MESRVIATSYGRQQPLELTFELSHVTCVKIEKEVFHLDQFKNQNWRLTYTHSLIPRIDRFNKLAIDQSGKKIEIWEKNDAGEKVKVRELPLKSVVQIGGDVGMLHVEPDARGQYRILATAGLIKSMKEFDGLVMLREKVNV